jgi:hypothetical protein
MPLHLIKLCVGIDDIAHLRTVQRRRLDLARAAGETPRLAHVTRQTPRRRDELLDGGSLYWVIRGFIQVRQSLRAIETFTDEDGIRRCRLLISTNLVAVRPTPRRPFQGWRYLGAGDAPPDSSGQIADAEDMPADMRAQLMEMGLL